MTLRQIMRQSPAGRLPCLRIEDWPDYPQRGVMWDISRDRVPTMATLYQLVDLLAECKVNQFQLYMEHTFAYRQHRAVWENASPLTGEEVEALDRYCRERFIELVPNQNSFGHMERWLKHRAYHPLAEAPDGFTFPHGQKVSHGHTLCPIEPKAIAFLEGLYAELLPHFSSRQVNVGCDETWELGRGRSRVACEQRGTGRVYLEFLKQIHRLVQRHGQTMQFWADIANNHPEIVGELPEGVIAMEWGYSKDHPFDQHNSQFAAANVPYYVCPSTHAHLSLGGRTRVAMQNQQLAAASGLKHGALGFLNTNWGDGGHFEPPSISFAPLAYGAAISWCGAANRDLDLARTLDVHVFQDRSGVMGKFVCDFGNLCHEAAPTPSRSCAFSNVLLWPDAPVVEGRLCEGKRDGFQRTLPRIRELLSVLARAQMDRPDAGLIIEEFRLMAALMAQACRLGFARLDGSPKPAAAIAAATRRELAAELEPVLPQFRDLWPKRSRLGGLGESTARLQGLMEIYLGTS